MQKYLLEVRTFMAIQKKASPANLINNFWCAVLKADACATTKQKINLTWA